MDFVQKVLERINVSNFELNGLDTLCYKKIPQFHPKCLLMRDCLLFRRLLLPESTALYHRYRFTQVYNKQKVEIH